MILLRAVWVDHLKSSNANRQFRSPPRVGGNPRRRMTLMQQVHAQAETILSNKSPRPRQPDQFAPSISSARAVNASTRMARCICCNRRAPLIHPAWADQAPAAGSGARNRRARQCLVAVAYRLRHEPASCKIRWPARAVGSSSSTTLKSSQPCAMLALSNLSGVAL